MNNCYQQITTTFTQTTMQIYLNNCPKRDWRDEESRLLPDRERNDYRSVKLQKKRKSPAKLKVLALPVVAMTSFLSFS